MRIIPGEFFDRTQNSDDDRRITVRLLQSAGLLPKSVVIEGREVDFALSNCDENETAEAFNHYKVCLKYDDVVEVACYPKGTVCLHELTVNEVDEAVKGVKITTGDGGFRQYHHGEAFKELKEACLARWLGLHTITMTADLGGKELRINGGLRVSMFVQVFGAETLMDILGLNIGFVACNKEEKNDEKD